MPSKIDFRTHSYFPNNFITLGFIFLPASVVLVFIHIVAGIVIFVLGVLFTTTHYRLAIDPVSQTYRDYVWIFGIKNGNPISYKGISHIYINKVERGAEYGFVTRLSTYKVVLVGYLKLSGGDSLYLGETSNEKKFTQKMTAISEALGNTPIHRNF